MAATFDLVIDQGADFSTRFTLVDSSTQNPSDLTGYIGVGQIRDGAGNLQGSFSVTPAGAAGTVDLFIDDAATSAIAAGMYKYDILLRNAGTGDAQRVAQGSVRIDGRVSL